MTQNISCKLIVAGTPAMFVEFAGWLQSSETQGAAGYWQAAWVGKHYCIVHGA